MKCTNNINLEIDSTINSYVEYIINTKEGNNPIIYISTANKNKNNVIR